MGRLKWFLFLAFSSVFCDGSVTSVFSSLRRTDNSDEKTYHFSKVDTFKPVDEPIIYADGYNDNTKMIVGFQNMIIFGVFENEKHYVIRVNEDLDQDLTNIPSQFLNNGDSGELFDIVTLKPTEPPTTAFPRFRDSVKELQRETLPGFDPDTQTLSDYLQQVSYNMSRLHNQQSDDE
ncbi:uncharacterized protein LOC119068596 [Bradysia coprophila]|uniref:uncharacterized protein LOC119068596 n=1 Tax=Bradysia coprophila TaxID=38358 RepID=UPI00187DC6C6|nr:uncharacterized protein LOC119068596 [Bradysia coprophila]